METGEFLDRLPPGQQPGRHALVSLCIGLGQGIACVIERLD